MLQVKDIHTYYGGIYILQGISMTVEPGAIIGLLGRNGVGKTTFIRSIIGLTPVRRGKIFFKGLDMTNFPSHKIFREGIGLVPQGRRIFASLTVKENLMIGVRKKGHSRNLEKVFMHFPRLKERIHHRGKELSGGEQQMLAFGRCLMAEPDLMLMDEPSEGLSPLILKELAKTIRQIREEGHLILLTEQNLSFALSVVTRVHLVSKGRIVYESLPEELLHDEEMKHRYLGI
jgi:branched-chain amino acid transport system ATP-binding protein